MIVLCAYSRDGFLGYILIEKGVAHRQKYIDPISFNILELLKHFFIIL